MILIQNSQGTVTLPYEPDLLEWLQKIYPYSQYHLVEFTHEVVS
jgi:hypothetical protein